MENVWAIDDVGQGRSAKDIAETVDEVHRHAALGYRAIRAQSGVPGLNKVYGVAADGKTYEPATRGLPTEQDWDTAKYLRHAPQLFQAVRDAIGWEHHLLHDVHHRLTPIEAARLGKDLEPYRLFWMEDAVPAENQEAFKIIRQHTTTPLAVGEIFNTIWDCKDLIQHQLIDFIRTTVVHAGGITHLRRIADLAALYQVRTGCHGATDLSPVCMGAALHFDLAVPNFGIQEHMPHNEATDEEADDIALRMREAFGLRKLSATLARTLGLEQKGHLGIGADADVTVIDPDEDDAVFKEFKLSCGVGIWGTCTVVCVPLPPVIWGFNCWV